MPTTISPTDTPAPPRQRSYAAGVRFVLFDDVLLVADLVPEGRPNRDAGTKCNLVCTHDDHDTPATVAQTYDCPDGHGPFRLDQLARARTDGDVTRLITKDEALEVATGGLPSGEIHLRVHPADQVEQATRRDGLGYRLRLPKKTGSVEAGVYGVFAALASRPDLALLGELRVQDGSPRRLYRLELHRGQLVATALVHPADLAAVDIQEAPANERMLAMVSDLAELMVSDFVPDEYRYDADAAMAEIMARPAPEPAAPGADDGGLPADVVSLLEKQLQAKAKAKATGAKAKAAKPRGRKRATAKAG